MAALHAEAIFGELFDLPRILRLRRMYHFRFSLQMDGVRVTLGFGHWYRYLPSQFKKEAKTKEDEPSPPNLLGAA